MLSKHQKFFIKNIFKKLFFIFKKLFYLFIFNSLIKLKFLKKNITFYLKFLYHDELLYGNLIDAKKYYYQIISTKSSKLINHNIVDNFFKKYQSTDLSSDFDHFIRNKKVAIVGPSAQEYNYGEEIDSFDIVVRTNFSSKNQLDYNLYGSNCDISYYNNIWTNSRMEFVRPIIPKLKWLCFKDVSPLNQTNYFSDSDISKFRFLRDCNGIFKIGSPLGIQNIITDLILSEPKSIKLFSITSFLGDRPYSKNYTQYRNNEWKNVYTATSLRLHDLIQNFIFLKSCINIFDIDLCKITNQYHSIDLDEYLNRINFIYGNNFFLKIPLPHGDKS